VLQPLKKYPKKIRDSVDDDMFVSLKHAPIEQHDTTLPAVVAIRKVLRESGRPVYYTKLHLVIYGFEKGFVISKLKKPRAV
jgi:hypothetical protein